MSSFERVRAWLAASLALREAAIEPASTLGELLHQREQGPPLTPEDEGRSASSFLEDFTLDSLDLVELVMSFEAEFGLELPERETGALSRLLLDPATTIQHLVDWMDQGTV